jgi:hypothetical protein
MGAQEEAEGGGARCKDDPDLSALVLGYTWLFTAPNEENVIILCWQSWELDRYDLAVLTLSCHQ